MCVRNQRNQVLQGRAAPRWVGKSSAGEAVERAAAPVQLLKGGTTHQCGMKAGADCGRHQHTGSSAALKVCLLPEAKLEKSNTQNCSLPVKMPISPIRLWLRDLKNQEPLFPQVPLPKNNPKY